VANIIVTGGLGWIGRNVVRHAQQNGHNVGILDYLDCPRGLKVPYAKADITAEDQVRDALVDLECSFWRINLGRTSSSEKFYIVHTAADFNYSSSLEKLRAVNVVGTRNVVEQAARLGYRGLVNIGAAAEYGDDYEIPIKEDFELKPSENYGLTKMLAEELLFDFNKKGNIRVASLRAPMVYGPDAVGTYIAGLFNAARGPLIAPMRLTTNSYAHIDDVAGACVHAIESAVFNNNPRQLSDIAYNIADDSPVDERKILELAGFLATGKHRKVLPVIPYPILKLIAHASEFLEVKVGKKSRSTLAPGMVVHSKGSHVLDNSKFKKATKFEYRYPSVEEGFPEVVEWFRTNVWNR